MAPPSSVWMVTPFAGRSATSWARRSKDAGATTRAIAASPDRAARLRDIAWLAGNLLRDQVSPIVRLPPPDAPKPAAATDPPPVLRARQPSPPRGQSDAP